MRMLPALCLVASLLPACARPEASPASHAGAHTAHGLYHLAFVFTTTDGAAKTTTQTFEQVVEEDDNAFLHAGKNVPLVLPSIAGAKLDAVPRQDVGLKVKSRLEQRDGRLVVGVDFEESAAEDTNPVTIRKMSTYGKALVTAGQPAEIFRIDEAGKRYSLSVVAKRL